MIFIKTEYSFKEVFYPIERAVLDAKELGYKTACIIDNTTFGHLKFERLCKEHGITPVYGLEVMVTDKSEKSRSVHGTCESSENMVIIAKNIEGLVHINELWSKSTERKNRFNRILPEDICRDNVIVIGDKFPHDIQRNTLCMHTAKCPTPEDIPVYQCITGARGYPVIPEHMLSIEELEKYYTKSQTLADSLVEGMVSTFDLNKAEMIKYTGNRDFETDCWNGLYKLGFEHEDRYKDRLEYEIRMIKEKNFQDYFMIVSDMIHTAKKGMIVGPGRGSSGGSLVCYCLGITNIDPIRFGLIFERFIDINRNDYPDIDTDYPDTRRGDVIAATKKKYKAVHKLATITEYSPKTILNDFAKEYDIPPYELNDIKTAIIERSSGDARAKDCLADTLSSDAGRLFLENHPYMKICPSAEGHARHFGTHAAGIIVLDEDPHKYGAINYESDVLCLEGKDAEGIGLLKIDCLGLRTLSVIQDCLALSEVPFSDIYGIDLEDPAVLGVFNEDDLSDIFQFDGASIGMVCGRITVKAFNDLVAITALGRPGALNSGGTDKYIKINEGELEPVYYGDLYQKITEPTNSIVVYQEQTMVLLREFGGLSWQDVNIMRRAISKSKGDEFFSKYKVEFIKGAEANGYTAEQAEIVWGAIASMGSYAFNKSHAVAYAMISYWCAYCKHKYPLNFLASNLNNAKDEDHALKMLRRYVKTHDIDYVTVDADLSDVGWAIVDGKLMGGLTNIKGIGEKKARDIIKRRKTGSFTKSMMKILMNPVTIFDELYPIETTYKWLYDKYNIDKIEEITPGVDVAIIGKLLVKDLRDRNDVQSVIKRGHKVDTNTHYMNLIIEDDTGSIKGTIAPFDMEKLEGMELAETLKIGEVIAMSGRVREGWQTLSIKKVVKVEDIKSD